MTEAIKIACEIYRQRAESEGPHSGSTTLISHFRDRVVDVNHNAEGAHALVWSYFIAAAESTESEDREFFAARLRALYSRTRFRSISVAMDNLARIWSVSNTQRWTEVMPEVCPVLVM